MQRMATTMAAILLLSISALTQAEELVSDFSGSGNTTTSVFTVEAPWLLDWRLDGDYEALVALDLALIDASTGRHVGRILHTKRIGNGLKLFNEAGSYKLRVSSTLAQWRIRIKQIKPEDAKRYTPRGGN